MATTTIMMMMRLLATVVTVLVLIVCYWCCMMAPQWGAADAEIKVPSDENTELKGSPFHLWGKSVYSHAC